jgi:hypothetical protein
VTNLPTPSRVRASGQPATPTKDDTRRLTLRVFGLLLGIAGMALYCGGVQCAWRGPASEMGTDTLFQIGAASSSVGCMLFCTAIAMIWQLSLKRLMLLVALAGALVSSVVAVNREAIARNSGRFAPPQVTVAPLTAPLPQTQPAQPLPDQTQPEQAQPVQPESPAP